MLQILLSKLSGIFATVGVFAAVAFSIYLWGRNSKYVGPPTANVVKKDKQEVHNEQSHMDTFDKLDALDNSIHKL